MQDAVHVEEDVVPVDGGIEGSVRTEGILGDVVRRAVGDGRLRAGHGIEQLGSGSHRSVRCAVVEDEKRETWGVVDPQVDVGKFLRHER